MIDENKETHYYNMKAIKLMRWSIEKLCYLQLMESISIENCYHYLWVY